MNCVPAETKQVIKLLGEANDNFEKEKFQAAQVTLDQAASVAKKAEIQSASLLMCRAVNLGALDRDEEAFSAICAAIVGDPLNPDFGAQFVTIAQRLRTSLEKSSKESADDETPRIYAQLSAVGETDVTSHLALARYHLAKGEHDAAFKILESLTLLQPSLSEAWQMLAKATRDTGEAQRFLLRGLEAQAERAATLRTPEVN